ncbi:phage tail sheath family protein [Winogradskyella bathintestinalis]|uniref:Phage tail sheath subtilisin-like domain-containing protein n=1 Tax=Winogradskyella bathintestinalis TaxID=3035208 RepID=A0ABT7ZXR9_9FLAO|nr:phage tail sheath C-terminal domain-containing protein [Winogradskyella bathintestinalis]MDN3493795.1 phage tail sheath subtilisin-like domain-containing protein [Winogradskyella bathintestinalis]
MAAKFKYPGVYIKEVHSFSDARIVEVPTAIPAFIGYTEKAINQGKSVLNKPVKIDSIQNYIDHFGEDFTAKFDILDPEPNETRTTVNLNGIDKVIDFTKHTKAFMYKSLKLFFANGGDTCYIISVGTYENTTSLQLSKDALSNGLQILEEEQEPTMVIIPDAVNLEANECYQLYQEVMNHCNTLKNRIAILDVHSGYEKQNRGRGTKDVIKTFRKSIGSKHLGFGVAYYPWLNTNFKNKRDFNFSHINLKLRELATLLPEPKVIYLIKDFIENKTPTKIDDNNLHLGLLAVSPVYNELMNGIYKLLNRLPPSSAIAGIYAQVDSNRGVWKAPANVNIAAVISPSVQISASDQDYLNFDSSSGKSINALRTFPGKGLMVWGARTLDGNHSQWKYVNVKRTVIMLEQSIKLALLSFQYQQNTVSTWTSVKIMIENYLTELWKSGAFAGSRATDAFGVSVGLGQTMSNTDILNGLMIVDVYVAILKPAEFISIRCYQKMLES